MKEKRGEEFGKKNTYYDLNSFFSPGVALEHSFLFSLSLFLKIFKHFFIIIF